MASMEVTTDGSTVTATISGTGATFPAYGIVWGDGTEDAAQTATHTYAASGQYQICFIYYDEADIVGCYQSACQDVIITGDGCTLNVTPFILSLTTSLVIDYSGVSAPEITINWGDGSPIEYGFSGTHSYALAGTYNICVNMVDLDFPDSCNLIQCVEVDLQEQTGSCEVTLNLVVDGAIVTAEAIGTGAVNENYIITWGDNSFTNGSTGVHSYDIAGTYEVCAVYGDFGPDGCSVSDCETIQADAGNGDCTLTVNATPLGLTVGITANGVGADNPEYSVDWGDGSPIEFGVPAVHTYDSYITYLVCVSYLDLNNIVGCQVNECVEVTLEDVATDCTVDINVVVDGTTVTANAVGEGAANPQYIITWGDGGLPTTGATGAYTYANTGSYQVCVTYVDLDAPLTCNVTDCELVDKVLENVLGVNAISIMPNPLSDNSILEFTLNHNSDLIIDVFDMLGNKVENIFTGTRGQGTHKINWNTSTLAQGIYFVKVKSATDEKTARVIR